MLPQSQILVLGWNLQEWSQRCSNRSCCCTDGGWGWGEGRRKADPQNSPWSSLLPQGRKDIPPSWRKTCFELSLRQDWVLPLLCSGGWDAGHCNRNSTKIMLPVNRQNRAAIHAGGGHFSLTHRSWSLIRVEQQKNAPHGAGKSP